MLQDLRGEVVCAAGSRLLVAFAGAGDIWFNAAQLDDVCKHCPQAQVRAGSEVLQTQGPVAASHTWLRRWCGCRNRSTTL